VAEQVVAPDASRISPSHAGCSRLIFIVVIEGFYKLSSSLVGLSATVMPLLGGLRG
jgi:hypothetical protein